MNTLSVRALLVRGMLAGLAAGVAALLVAYFLGESRVDAAIALEEHAAGGHHDHGGGEEELVSRAMQATGGLATGVLVFGVAIGGIAAIAFCVALGRIGRFGPRATAAFVALGGLIAVYVVPFLKYPANPPAVGDGDTIGKRTALFFLLVLLSVLLAVGAVLLGRRLAPRLGNWNATVAAGAAFLLAVTLAYVFLPSYNEVGPDFPGQLLWQFRLATLAVQAVLWTVFGLVFGALAERLLTPESARPRPAETVAA
ncbi:CbtA family protein [Streptomyces sp. CAI-21]|uniref:CbtA family protein n=1 Tax=Streptomyces TaxID=1883 RepID=UPI000249405D|nr:MULTISPECIES: CbtA family protein [Streptomyces]MBO1287116.1 CbtA family protein [Streptomyces sampsonii]NUW08160.1 CbtA family protein [Streptomyces sp. CAI-21]NVI33282.1 CbtA family protein [Streptomyces sp. CAI-17]AMM08166.1 membrane protein [Streptomyces albidoflavus]MBV7651160.1 CbtA family protein [Streptomyces albidoflavus]